MFQVAWESGVQVELLELWALADPLQQARISKALNEVERRLKLDPLNEGESRDDDTRITFEPPLAITFRVDNSAKEVTVSKAWLID